MARASLSEKRRHPQDDAFSSYHPDYSHFSALNPILAGRSGGCVAKTMKKRN
jgi:hypothetical protein